MRSNPLSLTRCGKRIEQPSLQKYKYVQDNRAKDILRILHGILDTEKELLQAIIVLEDRWRTAYCESRLD